MIPFKRSSANDHCALMTEEKFTPAGEGGSGL